MIQYMYSAGKNGLNILYKSDISDDKAQIFQTFLFYIYFQLQSHNYTKVLMYAIEIIVFVLMILAILEIIASTKLGQIVIKTVTFKKT